MKTETYNDVRRQDYLIAFRGTGALTESKILTSCDSGVAAAARSAAEYWCRVNGSPFAVYSVEGAMTGTVSVDVGAPYTVFVTDPQSGVRLSHDFRKKADCDGFFKRCCDAGIKADVIHWLKKRTKAVAR
jgi:hypothetical protein